MIDSHFRKFFSRDPVVDFLFGVKGKDCEGVSCFSVASDSAER